MGLFHSDRAGPSAGQHQVSIQPSAEGLPRPAGTREEQLFSLGGAAHSRALHCTQEGKRGAGLNLVAD